MISINTDVSSLVSNHYLNKLVSAQNKLTKSLASGYRIYTASDDAAGLVISKGIESQIRSANVTAQSIQTANSALSVAEGSLFTVEGMLLDIRDIATKASSDIYSPSQRAAMQTQVDSLYSEIQRTIDSAKFNDKQLLVTDNGQQIDSISIMVATGYTTTTAVSYDPSTLKLETIDLSTAETAAASLAQIDTQRTSITSKRAEVGTQIGTLGSIYDNLQTTAINLEAAHSSIVDTDYAKALADKVKLQIQMSTNIALFGNHLSSSKNIISSLIGSL